MYFDRYKFFRLPNGMWCCTIFGVKEVYGNVHGVNRGLCIEDSMSLSFIKTARYVLGKHKRIKRNYKLNHLTTK